MKFFEKVKNMFTEEVEEDVKVEQIKKEITHVPIESPNVKDDDSDEKIAQSFKFEDEISTKNKPIFFDDNDFKDLNIIDTPKDDSKTKVEPQIYSRKSNIENKQEEKKIFKPTPIISPVYGILDKNYHKEDIVSKSDIARNDKEEVNPSIDSIRNKAYGTLEDELENTLFGTNSILFKKDQDEDEEVKVKEVDDDVLSNLTDDISKELDELLIKKEKQVEEEINDKDNNDSDEDLLGFIDSTLYKDGDEE